MTADYLLDALGLLDDDLIQDAEVLPAPTRLSTARKWTERLATLAACLVLVLTLGYVVSNMGMGGDTASTESTAGMPSSSIMADASTGASNESSTCTSAGQAEPSTPAAGTIFLHTQRGNLTYTLSGRLVEELPEDCRDLGELAPLQQDGKGETPATDGEAYVGCPLWAAGEDTIPAALYVQLPDGRYALAELV